MAKHKKHHSSSRGEKMDRNVSGGKTTYERTRSLGGQNYDPQSGADSGMLNENMHDHANLPTNVIMRDYPGCEYADFPYLDDTIRAIDERQRENEKAMKKGMGKNIRY